MKTFRTAVASLLLLLLSSAAASAQDAGDRILGIYNAVGETTLTESHVRFYKEGDCYVARIIWLDKTTDNEGNILTDILNPDPELRSVPADQIVLVRDVRYDSKKDMWTGGTVYNPVTGKTYSVQITFDTPKRLKVRGYVGTPMMGKNFFWDKLK